MKWTMLYLLGAVTCSALGTVAIRNGRKSLPWSHTLTQRARALQELSRTGWRPQRFAWVFILASLVLLYMAITS